MSSAYSRQSRVLGDIYRLALHQGRSRGFLPPKPNDFRYLRHAHIYLFTTPICRTSECVTGTIHPARPKSRAIASSSPLSGMPPLEYAPLAAIKLRQVAYPNPFCRCSLNRGNIFAKDEEPTKEESMLPRTTLRSSRSRKKRTRRVAIQI